MPNITTAALAALADCSLKTVRKWALQQKIERVGRDYLFTPEQVAAFLSRDRKPGRKLKPDAALSRSGRSRRRSRKEKAND